MVYVIMVFRWLHAAKGMSHGAEWVHSSVILFSVVSARAFAIEFANVGLSTVV